MNFGSDRRVCDAFRATLQGEPSSRGVLGTQEIDAADILEVTDLATAIARAEEVIRARSSRVLTGDPDSSPSREERRDDLFDRLLSGERSAADGASATDDALGPAVHVPHRPTPLPPRTSSIPVPPGVSRPATLLRAPEEIAISASPKPAVSTAQPLLPLSVPPAEPSEPMLPADEDAFYHPVGRIRTLADVTLEGYRPEPTLMVRLRARRSALTWVVAGILAALALVALFVMALGFGAALNARATQRVAPPAAISPAEAPPAPTSPPAAKPTATAPEIPVFDVNSLENAPAAPRR